MTKHSIASIVPIATIASIAPNHTQAPACMASCKPAPIFSPYRGKGVVAIATKPHRYRDEGVVAIGTKPHRYRG